MADATLIFDTQIDNKDFDKEMDSMESAIRELRVSINNLATEIRNAFSSSNINDSANAAKKEKAAIDDVAEAVDKKEKALNKSTSAVGKETAAVERQEGVVDKLGEAWNKALDDSLAERIIEDTKKMGKATGIAGSFENALNGLKNMFSSVNDKMAEFFSIKGNKSDSSIEVINGDEAGRIEKASSKMMSLQEQIRKAEVQLEKAKQELENFSNQQIPTNEYVEVQNQISRTSAKLNELQERQEKYIATGGKTGTSTYKKMQYDIDNCKRTLNEAEKEMGQLVVEGKAFSIGNSSSEKMKKFEDNVNSAQNKVDVLKQKMVELEAKENAAIGTGQKMGNSMSSAMSKSTMFSAPVASAMDKIKSKVLSVATSAGKMGLKFFSALNPMPKLISGIVSKFGGLIKRIGGLAKRVFIFTVITKALRSIKEIMGNLFTADPKMNSYLAQIKGNLITAFAPIYNYILPAIRTLMSALVTLTSYLANITSKIFGTTLSESKKLGKALANQASSTDNVTKATKNANEQLADYDELNVMSNDSNDSSGSSTIAPTFSAKEMKIGWVDQIKKLIKKDKWEKIGRLISDKLADALESIKWSKIKKKCSDIVSKVARLLNGFFSNMRLSFDIGATIAELLNTGLVAAYTFLTTFDFEQFGKFIGNSIIGFIKTFDWGLLGNTLGAAVQGAIDTAYGFVTTYEWGSFAAGLAETINKFFSKINWSKAGDTVGKAIIGIFTEISTFLGKVDWKQIGRDIADFFSGIDWAGVARAIFTALGNALGGSVLLLWGAIEDAVIDIRDYFKSYVEDVEWYEIPNAIFDGIADGIKNLDEWVKTNIFRPFWRAILSVFGLEDEDTNKMIEIGESISGSLLDGIGGPIPGILKMLMNFKDDIKAIFKGLEIGFKIPDLSDVAKLIKGGGFSAAFTVSDSSNFTLDTSKYKSVPYLATGAVIPPRAPFTAVLGDQKNGTNIEAPLDTIKQGLKEVLESGTFGTNQNVAFEIYLEADADKLFKITRTKAKQYSNRTGKPAFQ